MQNQKNLNNLSKAKNRRLSSKMIFTKLLTFNSGIKIYHYIPKMPSQRFELRC